MHPVKQRLIALLAQARGTRWDRVASRLCGCLALLAGLAPYAHLIPGPTGAIIAGLLGFTGQFLPRAQKAAGLLSLAYGQQTPLLKVLPELLKTLVAAPQITADAKAQDKAAAQKQAQDAFDQRVEQKVEAVLKSGMFTAGAGAGNLSEAVPETLRAAALPDMEGPSSGLTSITTVADKTI